MYTLELTLKNTALPLTIQKQTLEAAKAAYQEVSDALRSGRGDLLELTCDQSPEKRLSVLPQELAAVQMYEKTGAASGSGRPPGFFSLLGEQ